MFLVALLLACPPPIIFTADTESQGIQDTSDLVEAVDADGDGYSADVDCNDSDVEVNPGATEVWYNGVDENCDENDCDQDGDGEGADIGSCVGQGDDCDDMDADIGPGATEIWYDGVDQDCDGHCDFDADLDGWALADATGDNCMVGDCDDTLAELNPGAVDYLDGLDTDCSGGNDDLDQLDDVVLISGGGGSFGLYLATSDSDEDGHEELWIASPNRAQGSGGYGSVERFDGATLNTRQNGSLDFSKAESNVSASAGSSGLGQGLTILDLRSDRRGQLLMGDKGQNQVLFFVEQTDPSSQPSNAPLSSWGSVSFMLGTGAYEQLTTNGTTYLLMGATESADASGGAVFLLDEATISTGLKTIDSLGYALRSNAQASDGLGSAVAVLDLDGDGLDDLVLGAPGSSGEDGKTELGRLYVLSADDLLDLDQGRLGTNVDISSQPQVLGDVVGSRFGMQLLALPDTNGDGNDEVVAVSRTTGGTRLHVLYGGGSFFEHTASFTDRIDISRESARTVPFMAAGDLDGDDLGDLVVGNGDADAVYVFLDGTLGSKPGLTRLDANAEMRGVPRSGFGTSLGFVDALDADGEDELVVAAPTGDGSVYLVRMGF